MKRQLYREIASAIIARKNCEESGNSEWYAKHSERIENLENLLPSGSGIDCGCKIDLDRSNEKCIVITFSYHAMNDNGMYVGWYDYTLRIRPHLLHEIVIGIAGSDKHFVKDYFYDTFNYCLTQEVEERKGSLCLIA